MRGGSRKQAVAGDVSKSADVRRGRCGRQRSEQAKTWVRAQQGGA